jgi:hypothetical protein
VEVQISSRFQGSKTVRKDKNYRLGSDETIGLSLPSKPFLFVSDGSTKEEGEVFGRYCDNFGWAEVHDPLRR